MYPKEFIDELKNTIPISLVVGKKVALKRKGRDYWACCPFHAEKTASFSVSDIRGIYKCFGCGKSGNIFTFIMDTEGLNFKEAIEYLSREFGIQLPKVERENKNNDYKIEKLYELNEIACKFFEYCITKYSIAINYAEKRGITFENIKKFRIGYAPDDYLMLLKYMSDRDVSESDLYDSGLIVKKEQGGYYDKFRNRLMFPVLNKQGKVIAFQGRTISDGIPKYLNTPETKIFIKGNTLFNLYYAVKFIRDNGFAILVEGNMDAISLAINGIENVVAPMGTGVTLEQIKILWGLTSSIIVCFDGDDAGQKAMVRLSKLVLPIITVGKDIKFIFLPKDTDPDDFIKKQGVIKFYKIVENALSLSEYIWKNEIKNFDINIPEDKAKIENNLNILMQTMSDDKLEKYFRKFYNDKIYGKKNNKKEESIINTNNNVIIDEVKRIEEGILLRLIKFPDIIEKLKEDDIILDTFEFVDEKSNLVLEMCRNKNVNVEELLKEYDISLKIFDEWKLEDSLDSVKILLMERKKELIKRDKDKSTNMIEINILNDKIKEINQKIDKYKSKNDFI